MQKFIIIYCLMIVLLLFGCSQSPEIVIQKNNNYEYSQKTVFDTNEYNETWNVMNSGAQEERYRMHDRKLGISLDYLHVFYSGEQSELQMYRATGVDNKQEFLYAWWWRLGIIESDKSIENNTDFLDVIKESNTGYLLSGCYLKTGANHTVISQIFTGDRYRLASYSDYFPIDEGSIGKCPYSHELLMVPTFVYDKKSPRRILVIVDSDGRSGLSYWKGMGTLIW